MAGERVKRGRQAGWTGEWKRRKMTPPSMALRTEILVLSILDEKGPRSSAVVRPGMKPGFWQPVAALDVRGIAGNLPV
jgi:hypothetical protein